MPGEPEQCIVVVGGDAPDLEIVARLAVGDGVVVIAADSGVDHALAAGLHVDVAVGDFDSVSMDGLDAVVAAGARIERHPEAKDHTDLELALDEALAIGAADIVVVGGDGGRRDHLFANLLVLAASGYASCAISAHLGRSRVHIVHGGSGPVRLEGEIGELVSLLPVHGPADGIRTRGLRYPLHHESLPAGTTRGVSNVRRVVAGRGATRCGHVGDRLPRRACGRRRVIGNRGWRRNALIAIAGVAMFAAACSSGSGSKSGSQTITVVTHDSFAVSDNVLKAFEDQSGITVKQVKSGDAGALVNQAILTKDHPQGDVLYGIDNTLADQGTRRGSVRAVHIAGVERRRPVVRPRSRPAPGHTGRRERRLLELRQERVRWP